MDYGEKALEVHRKNRGKIEIKTKIPLKTKDDLAIAYTPGVAKVSEVIGKNKQKSYELTNRGNQIAIVSDGTAVLGLGNIGPEAALPVMEGKAAILKEFANIDAIPLCINTTDPKEIIKFCKYIEPSFAGINLEDIAAPRCFEILPQLEKELSIPVFHDDQDGTAIVVLAALINACRVTGKVMSELKVVVNGAGAAGISIARLLLTQNVKDITMVDSCGVLHNGRCQLDKAKKDIAVKTNKQKTCCGLQEAMYGRDVFIGVSVGNLVNEKMIKLMNADPIIFAMANPTPEVKPGIALRAGASIVGTGRSDFPNQINNALVFPGLFKGLLGSKTKKITEKLKIAIAVAIAYSVKPNKNKILPLLTDRNNVEVIANTIKKFNG